MRVLLTGASGQLGGYVLDELRASGAEVIAWGGPRPHRERSGIEVVPIDLESADIPVWLDVSAPDFVIHLAAISTAEGVRLDIARAHLVNVVATQRIADWCARKSRGMLFTSTDLVFDATKPWRKENETPCPIMLYGLLKAFVEPSVQAIPRGLVARVSLLYGFSRIGRETYFDRTMNALRNDEIQTLFLDEFRTPLDLGTAAKALVAVALRGVTGTIHIAGKERMSRFDLIQRAAVALGLDPDLVQGNWQSDVKLRERRPADVSLDTSRWDDVLSDVPRPTIEEVMRTYRHGFETP